MADSERNNYVTPCGDFYLGATHEFFGNRGPLHENGRVVRDWVNKRWLVCVTDDLVIAAGCRPQIDASAEP